MLILIRVVSHILWTSNRPSETFSGQASDLSPALRCSAVIESASASASASASTCTWAPSTCNALFGRLLNIFYYSFKFDYSFEFEFQICSTSEGSIEGFIWVGIVTTSSNNWSLWKRNKYNETTSTCIFLEFWFCLQDERITYLSLGTSTTSLEYIYSRRVKVGLRVIYL